MRELTELENWILALAGRTDWALPALFLQRNELKAILESANEGWGSKEDSELDNALFFLGWNGLIVNYDPLDQRPEGRQHKQIVKLSRRVEALELGRFGALNREFDVMDPFKITSTGQLKLYEIEAEITARRAQERAQG